MTATLIAGPAVGLASCGDSAPNAGTQPHDGWRTIAHQGVRVDVPADWQRADMDDCEFHFERWTPPGVSGCALGPGVSFYLSATFDPARGPGVHHDDTAEAGVAWEGYVDAGDLVVEAAFSSPAVLRQLLGSVRVGHS